MASNANADDPNLEDHSGSDSDRYDPIENDSDEPVLCRVCRKIDFQALLRSPRRSLYDDRRSYPRFPIGASPGCVLCRMLLYPHTLCRVNRYPPKFKVFGASYFEQCANWNYFRVTDACDGEVNAQDSITLRIEEPLRLDFGMPGPSNFIICYPSTSIPKGLFQPRLLGKTCNYSLVRGWLLNCDECHDCRITPSPSPIPDMKVIDCITRGIIDAVAPMQWIALSYVWGTTVAPSPSGPHATRSSTMPSRLPDTIPQTVEDAITVTKELGFRFLWVDEFCINQNSATHKAAQIQKMNSICEPMVHVPGPYGRADDCFE